MSYFRKNNNGFDITPGTAFEAFQAGTRSPMIPQAFYQPAAAGPRSLVGLGAHQYWAPLRGRKIPLRGMGDAMSDALQTILATGQPAINQASGIVLNAMWPALQAKLDEQLKPIKYFMGATAVAASVAAIFAFLTWNKSSSPSMGSMGGGWM